MRKFFKSFILTLFITVLLVSAASATALDPGKWDPGTRVQIQKMIDANGKDSSGYNPAKKPYAVFDWDQTCIFNDTEESLFRYMIDNVAFKASPAEFSDTQLTLIINRLRSDDFGKLGLLAIEQLGANRARYVLQGRDENTGQFRPSTSTIKMGADAEALLHSSLKQ